MNDAANDAGSPIRVAPERASDPFWRYFLPTLLFVGAVAMVVQGEALLILFSGVLAALMLKGLAEILARHTPLGYRAAVVLVLVVSSATGVVGAYFGGAALVHQARSLGREVARVGMPLLQRLRSHPAFQSLSKSSAPEPGALLHGARAAMSVASEIAATSVVTFFLMIYGALAPKDYPSPILRLVPLAARARVAHTLDDVGKNLTRWLLGRLVAIVFVGVTSTVGLLLMHVPLAFLLGVIAGLLAFVEYVGAFASVVPAMMLAVSRGPATMLGVGALYLGIHIVEGYVLTPQLARSTVRFPTGYALAAQVIGSSLYGIPGLTLATPLAVVVVVAVRNLYVEGVLGDVQKEGGDSKKDRPKGDTKGDETSS